ncbi:MAG: serine protease [Acidimicrobiia bacterium]|nr:serine protease [Acidimicrobiia bacterium]
MSSWQDVLTEVEEHQERSGTWLDQQLAESLARVGNIRGNQAGTEGDRMVILYGSSFLQRPQTPWGADQIMLEDINGFMACVHGMRFDQGLTLLLHTPGGSPNAAETIVNYLRSKFSYVEVIIPAYAMSAGTMISLSANRIILGRQSQMGPIDPQMITQFGVVSAQAVVDQFEQAKKEILSDQALTHVWAPILPSLGPSLLQEAGNALAYGERMVSQWLDNWMLASSTSVEVNGGQGAFDGEPKSLGEIVAEHFSDTRRHGSHGRRIDRDEARSYGLVVDELEQSQELQDAVLRAYHLMTVMFERSSVIKIIRNSTDGSWIKAHTPPG